MRVWGLGFRGLGFRVSGFTPWGLGRFILVGNETVPRGAKDSTIPCSIFLDWVCRRYMGFQGPKSQSIGYLSLG